MAVRKAGDADLDDAAFLYQATFDEFDGGMEWAGGVCLVAADDEDAPHRVFREPPEMAIEIGAAREASRRDVRHRLETGGGNLRDDIDLLGRRMRGDGADIDRRASGKTRPQRREVARCEMRRLKERLRCKSRDQPSRLGC